MQSLSDFILQSVPPKTKITNRRQYVVSMFVEELNKERVEQKRKPFEKRLIAVKLAPMSIFEMEQYYSLAMDYKHRKGSFGKYFWGCLKARDK